MSKLPSAEPGLSPLPARGERSLIDRLEALRRDHVAKAGYWSQRGDAAKAVFHYDAASVIAEAKGEVRLGR